MSKGGARLGAGRKPKEDGLKVANFRLSIEDLKILDKKGIGKNSSEKLRYILSKFKSEKINISKRRKAYNVEKFMSFEEADLKFHKLLSYWESLDKNKFLLESNLRNDLRLKFEIKNRKALETMEYFDELKKLEWLLQDINFIWIGAELSRVDVQLKKSDYSVTLPVTTEGNELIIKYMGEVIEETVDEIVAISLDEEDTLSYFYEDLQDILFKKNHPLNLSENIYYKKYINGDIYKTLEFDNIVVIELEYQDKDKTAVLNSIKDLISIA